MVAELGLPISLVGLFFAAPLFISPIRTWMGHRSDGHPLWGLRREPYVIVGSAFASAGIILAIMLLVGLKTSDLLLPLGVMLAFLIHELGRNLAHNSFQALLSDKFSEQGKARAITLFEIVTLLGLIMGAGGVASGLRQYSPERLVAVTIVVSVITFLFSVIAVLRNEPHDERSTQTTQAARQTPFQAVIRHIILNDPQIRRFFVLIILVVMGTLAQDVLLEPYGAFVLKMEVADTSRLTIFWGLGVMIAMFFSGMVFIQRFGQLTVMRLGTVVSIGAFIGVIISGVISQPMLFRSLVLLMGLGTGLAGAGLLASIIQFTTRVRTGTLLGVWGLAMIAGRSFGSLFGGLIADAVLLVQPNNFLLAYSTVFALEIVLLVSALVLIARLDMKNTKVVEEERRLLLGSAEKVPL
jgi:BCD family chlorophyll transporter-like MFS transporter